MDGRRIYRCLDPPTQKPTANATAQASQLAFYKRKFAAPDVMISSENFLLPSILFIGLLHLQPDEQSRADPRPDFVRGFSVSL